MSDQLNAHPEGGLTESLAEHPFVEGSTVDPTQHESQLEQVQTPQPSRQDRLANYERLLSEANLDKVFHDTLLREFREAEDRAEEAERARYEQALKTSEAFHELGRVTDDLADANDLCTSSSQAASALQEELEKERMRVNALKRTLEEQERANKAAGDEQLRRAEKQRATLEKQKLQREQQSYEKTTARPPVVTSSGRVSHPTPQMSQSPQGDPKTVGKPAERPAPLPPIPVIPPPATVTTTPPAGNDNTGGAPPLGGRHDASPPLDEGTFSLLREQMEKDRCEIQALRYRHWARGLSLEDILALPSKEEREFVASLQELDQQRDRYGGRLDPNVGSLVGGLRNAKKRPKKRNDGDDDDSEDSEYDDEDGGDGSTARAGRLKRRIVSADDCKELARFCPANQKKAWVSGGSGSIVQFVRLLRGEDGVHFGLYDADLREFFAEPAKYVANDPILTWRLNLLQGVNRKAWRKASKAAAAVVTRVKEFTEKNPDGLPPPVGSPLYDFSFEEVTACHEWIVDLTAMFFLYTEPKAVRPFAFMKEALASLPTDYKGLLLPTFNVVGVETLLSEEYGAEPLASYDGTKPSQQAHTWLLTATPAQWGRANFTAAPPVPQQVPPAVPTTAGTGLGTGANPQFQVGRGSQRQYTVEEKRLQAAGWGQYPFPGAPFRRTPPGQQTPSTTCQNCWTPGATHKAAQCTRRCDRVQCRPGANHPPHNGHARNVCTNN